MSILTPEEIQACTAAARKATQEGRDFDGCFDAEIENALIVHFKNLEQEHERALQYWQEEREELLRRNQLLLDQRKSWMELACNFEQERNYLASQKIIDQDAYVSMCNRYGALQDELELTAGTLESRERNIETLQEVNRELQAKLQELNLQYISDFGQLQEMKGN